jgi:hypothetical protein
LAIDMWVCSRELYSVALVSTCFSWHVSVFMPLPRCLDYLCLEVCLEIRDCEASSFVCLFILWLLFTVYYLPNTSM